MHCHPATPIQTLADKEKADFFLNKHPADADNRVQRVQECQRGKNGRETGTGGKWEVGQLKQEPLCVSRRG